MAAGFHLGSLRLAALLAAVVPPAPAAADACAGMATTRAEAAFSLDVAEPDIRNDLPLTVIERRRGRSATVLKGRIEIEKRVRYESEVRTRRAPAGGVCFWLHSVSVVVDVSPVTILIAEASRPSSCTYGVTLRHERQHLEYETAALEKALEGLRATVRGARRPQHADDAAEARKHARGMLARWVEAAMAEADAEAERHHRRLDSPENAKREQAQCDDW